MTIYLANWSDDLSWDAERDDPSMLESVASLAWPVGNVLMDVEPHTIKRLLSQAWSDAYHDMLDPPLTEMDGEWATEGWKNGHCSWVWTTPNDCSLQIVVTVTEATPLFMEDRP